MTGLVIMYSCVPIAALAYLVLKAKDWLVRDTVVRLRKMHSSVPSGLTITEATSVVHARAGTPDRLQVACGRLLQRAGPVPVTVQYV